MGGRQWVTRQDFPPGISPEDEEGCSYLSLVPREPSWPEIENSKTHWDQGGNISKHRYLENVPFSIFWTPTALLTCVSFFLFLLKHRTYFTFHITLLLETQQFKHMCQPWCWEGSREWCAQLQAAQILWEGWLQPCSG